MTDGLDAEEQRLRGEKAKRILDAHLYSIDGDEQRRIAETERAAKARRILEDETFKAAVEAVKDKVWRDFTASKSGSEGDESRRVAHQSLGLLDQVLANLRHHIATGKMAEEQLGMMDKVREALKRGRKIPAAGF